jgi:putative ABC transport system permease protein
MMQYRENISIGIQGLKSHMLRSLLSMLGIIFGVGAVIAMLSIGEGAKQQALETIQLMGMENIIIEEVPLESDGEEQRRSNKSAGLTWSDARTVRELNPLIETSVPVREMNLFVRHGSERVRVPVIGTTPEYMPVMNYVPRIGSFFTFEDVDTERRVCVLGNGITRRLFYFNDPLGKTVKIGDQWFTVIGVMEERGVAASRDVDLPSQDTNEFVYIPITTALMRFSRQTADNEINSFIARVTDIGRIQEAANILKHTLERRHNNVPDFRIVVPEALLRQSRQTQRIFNIVMGAIAGISLVVGGIGIMNIMLAAVMERTREIGIRRATGATRLDILSQFLFEAIILSFSGGMIGIVLGFTLTRMIAAYADWRTIVSWEAIILSFTVSAAVGVIFGVYPARRAARMDPIWALRYE